MNGPSIFSDPNERQSGLILKVVATTLSRILLNTSRRFIYPFAPVLSRGLGVPLSSVTSMIAVNQATGLLAVFFGPFSDRRGYRKMMLAGMAMLAAGMLAAAIFPFYGVVLVALFLAGLGKSIFDPAIQAYVSERISFKRRGMVIGILEFSWAGSTLIGIPMIGLLIDRLGWQSPFIVLGGMGLIGFLTLFFLIPKSPENTGRPLITENLLKTWLPLVKESPALGAILCAFFLSMANDNLFVVYGVWLEDSFGFSVVALGLSTTVIGSAELIGEFLTALMADRIGLKRSVFAGLIISALCYSLLSITGGHITTALTELFFIFLVFEFTVVAFLSLSTELLPASRATMMSAFFAASGLGRIAGALLGGGIWMAGGIAATGLISAGLTVLALISIFWGIRNWTR